MMRGELWWADFGLPFGSEPGFKRPVLILQNDSFELVRSHVELSESQSQLNESRVELRRSQL